MGASGGISDTGGHSWDVYYGGGGSGYMNQYNNIELDGAVYNFQAGAGGIGPYALGPGVSGGTSYIVNTIYSAIGGSAGNQKSGGKGGLGNGGNGSTGEYGSPYDGENSPVDFAGGGGGSVNWSKNSNGGKPYGAAGKRYVRPSPAQRGGGGGSSVTGASNNGAGNGGTGLMRINISYL